MWREEVVLGARAVSDNQLVGVTFDGGGSGKAEHETDTRLYSMTLMHTPSDRVRVAPVKSLVLAVLARSSSSSSLSIPLRHRGLYFATSTRVESLPNHVLLAWIRIWKEEEDLTMELSCRTRFQ